jgi:hypothetical protein
MSAAGAKEIAAQDELIYSVFKREELYLDRDCKLELIDTDTYYAFINGQIKLVCLFGPNHDLCHLAELGPTEMDRMFLPNFGWELTGQASKRSQVEREIRVRAYQWHLRIHLGNESAKDLSLFEEGKLPGMRTLHLEKACSIYWAGQLLSGAWNFASGYGDNAPYINWGDKSFESKDKLADWMLSYFFEQFDTLSFDQLVNAWKVKVEHLRKRAIQV